MNLPNKLTVGRLIIVPFCIFAVMIPESWLDGYISSAVAAFIFIAASVTDMIDGKLARKYGLITDFGKFLDPLADKFLVIGTLLAIVCRYDEYRDWLFWVVLVVIFREFAVTSIRLVVNNSSGIVIAANILGKIKTVMQIVAVSTILLEPVLYRVIELCFSLDEFILARFMPLTVITCILMLVFTVWSGINYIASYWKYLDPNK